jgi:ubiquinone/menaquinone biosynthesis C-methylase UbiE
VSYVPALRFRSLTRIYDPLIRMTTREGEFRRKLLDQAGLEPGQRVLDLGSGTGTLAVMAAGRQPGLEVRGLDADGEMIKRARAKAREAGLPVRFDHGFATMLPYESRSFDRVLSTLFLHHLSRELKRRTLSEVRRVLRKGGELHVADWGKPSDPMMSAAFLGVRLLDGMDNTADNAAGLLPQLMEDAGLTEAAEGERLRTPFGTLALYSAVRAT